MLCAVACAVVGTDGVFRATTNLPALITEDLLTSFILKAAEDSICTQIVTNKHNILITSSSRLRLILASLCCPLESELFFNQKIASHVYFNVDYQNNTSACMCVFIILKKSC